MAALGLTLDDLDDAIDVWPECLPAVNAFVAMGTQWRTGGMGQPVGLDYTAIPTVLRLQRVPRAAWPDLFEDLRVMEAEALRTMGEQHRG